MRRYWVDKKNIRDGQVEFSGDVFHHIFDVCRQKEGSHFEVLDGSGKAYLVKVYSIGRASAVGEIRETREISAPPEPRIHLALAVPRFPVFDAVIEKAVELGVHRLVPFFSEHSFVRGMDKISPARMERWRKIVLSATQQSGRGDIMNVVEPLPLEKLREEFNRTSSNWGLIAYEGETPVSIAEEIGRHPPPRTGDLWLFVGAEGGFSPEEVRQLSDWGIRPVTLGEQVLRVETACITLVSILKYEVGHFGGDQ